MKFSKAFSSGFAAGFSTLFDFWHSAFAPKDVAVQPILSDTVAQAWAETGKFLSHAQRHEGRALEHRKAKQASKAHEKAAA